MEGFYFIHLILIYPIFLWFNDDNVILHNLMYHLVNVEEIFYLPMHLKKYPNTIFKISSHVIAMLLSQ